MLNHLKFYTKSVQQLIILVSIVVKMVFFKGG